MIKKSFGDVKQGEIFYMEQFGNRLVKCIRTEYDGENNAVWLEYEKGAVDYIPSSMKVWADEED